jgi:predicted nucleotidyltransferase
MSPGSRLNRKEIKDRTKLNNVPLDKALAKLISSNMLVRERNYYSVNFNEAISQDLMKICKLQHTKLKEIPFDVYLLLVDLVSDMSSQKGIEAFLFGSYSKLVYKKDSDVDIAILTVKRLDKKRIEKLAEKLEKIYKKNIEIQYFDKKEFYKNKKDPLIKSILKDGTKLI